MTIEQEEIFGPVLSLIPYRNEDEAVKIANDTKYGLAGAVWSGAEDHAVAVARRLRTGQVAINGGKFNPLAPSAATSSPAGGARRARPGGIPGDQVAPALDDQPAAGEEIVAGHPPPVGTG